MTREEVYQSVQAHIEEEDLFAASAFVLGLGDTQTIVAAFSDLIFDCYHKAKSIAQVLHFGSAGIHYCLAAARTHDGKDETAAKQLRFAAKRMATNVASFTWPGWSEPGMSISDEQMEQGLIFARYSVRQLHELDPTAAQLAFTYWFLGAQLIAHMQYADALQVLKAAHAYNLEHGEDPEGSLMLEGHIGLAALLEGREESGECEFSAAVASLQARGSTDAQFYAEQLLTARAVFMEASNYKGAADAT